MFNPKLLLPVAAFTLLHLPFSIIGQDRQHDESSFTWNPGLSPEGPVVVSVNLTSQTAAVYRNGVEIGSCLVSTGREGYETPTGTFQILQKDADHHSSTYDNASMPFTERLTWGGVALHAGGLPGYPSSHGCIHLPYAFSERLFSITDVGGTVIISEEAPSGNLTGGHRVEFVSGEASDMTWKPHDSPSGPVSILFSASDKEVVVVRNGVVVGQGPASLKVFAKKPRGTYSFVCEGWAKDRESGAPFASWHQVGGPADSHMLKEFSHLKMDPRLKHVLDTVIAPGTTLIMTDDSISEATKSQPGFHIMHGTLAKKK